MARVFGLVALDVMAMILECSQERHHLAEQFQQPVIGFGLRGQILKLANELRVIVNLCHTPSIYAQQYILHTAYPVFKPRQPNRAKQPSDQPATAVPDTEYCCDGMVTLQVDQLGNHQRNTYGTTEWATDYADATPSKASTP